MTNPTCFGPLFTAIVSVLAFIVAACSDGSTPEATPTPAQAEPLRVSMASTDMAVGENRVVFALIRPGSGAVKDAQVEAQTFFLSGDASQVPVQVAPAKFQTWPGGTGGVYRTDLSFDRAGDWGLGIVATFQDGLNINGGARIVVKATSSTPAVGTAAPRSESKTAADASQLADITTDPNPDLDLYRITIANALGRV